MKRFISCLACLLFCISLAACGAAEKPAPNPLVGTWVLKSAQLEATFQFETNKAGVSGSYKYYDYGANNWGEFSFTLKEQTDTAITLLVDDGTMDVMPYTVIGNHLYLDGRLYTNANAEVPTAASPSTYVWMIDGQTYMVYRDVFMGMHAEDVRNALGEQFELERNNTNGDYLYSFECPYSAGMFIEGDYFHLSLGFDENRRLVHLQTQAHYDPDTVKDLVFRLNQELGETYNSIFRDDRMNYKWFSGTYGIELQIYVTEGMSDSFTLTYYYNPDRE